MLLHRLVVTLVVCTGSWVGARCLPAGSFRVKSGPRRRLAHSLCPKQPSRWLHGAPPTWRHTRARASSPCSPAVGRRTCDVSSKRLEHPPLASMHVILTDRELLRLRRRHHRPRWWLGPMSLFLTLTLLPWHSTAAPRWQVLLFPSASSALVPLSLVFK